MERTSEEKMEVDQETKSTQETAAPKANMPCVRDVQGPPGVGKTTTILCLAQTMLGPSYKNAVLELNASNDRTPNGRAKVFFRERFPPTGEFLNSKNDNFENENCPL
ncbi:RFC2 [Cordylochernes scorpioides]|uniref:RFC2 n=1 Tax=Cordylochernes scorpioides TaxID=51811 RepID=A0ABY6KDM7_9ARAC|nr:RFC2 [Cordylochernes scorpioides]